MKKNKISIIVIIVLAILALVEGILLISGALSKVPKNSNGEDILISLNDGDYTVNDIYNKLKSSYALSTIIDMVDNKILTADYGDKKDEVESYVKNAETNLKSNYVDDKGNYDEEKLLSALQNYGYNSIDAYLDTVRTSQYTEYATEDYAKTLLTEEEIKKYYDEKMYADMSGKHILVKPASKSTDDENKAKAKAEEIIKAIKEDVKNGTDINEAFEKYKDNAEVTFEDLGTFNYTQMDEGFSKAAYALKTNEMSSTPAKSSYGYHVILKTGESEKKSYDDAKEEIKTTLAKEKVDADSTLQVKAMMNIREKHGFKINDSELNEYYNRYINRQLNNSKNK